MATPITNQKSASVKYKFGDDELDLNDYIRNLNHNYQSYVNSQNWNEGQRQEFRSAYDNFLKGLQDQLANNTNRFSTDFSGSIIDSTGQLSNTDNDDIDPVGSEYYYNDKGDRITTDDLNTLRKRQQKKYSTFSANRQVATFFNKVGTALRDARKNKPATQNQSNAFNLSKHGFLANWTTANNPAGGEFNLSPYLEKDTLDETTGLRGTTNRAAYLKEQIENYLNNIGDYDFSGTPFKDRETYISKLRAAADNLGNGYDSEDVIALNQAGIGNEFLGQFFSTGSTDKPKTEAEQAAEDIVKMQQAEQDAALVKQRDQMQYEQERNKYFSDYLSQNPFQSSIQGTVLAPSYNRERMNVAAADKFKADKTNLASMQHAIKSYINLPQLYSFIRGKNKLNLNGQDITQAHIANNLDWIHDSDILMDPKYLNEQGKSILPNGYYVLPGSEDYQNWSYLAYNPDTRQYQEQSMLLNEELRKRMAYAEYDRTKNKTKQETPKQENGGVLMFQGGGLAKWVEENKKKAQEAQQKEQNIQTKVKETGKTREQIEAGERKPSEEGFSTIDKVRLGTAIADATAAAAAFVPGYGTAASGILGVGSTLTNIGADIADDSMSAGDVVKNAAYGLGMDIVGLIPGWGASGKAAKIVRILKPVSKLVMRSLQGYGMVQSAGAFSKLMSNPSDMSADDWRHIITGLQTIGGEARYRGAKIANKRELSRQQSATPYKTIVTESGNTVKLSPEQFNKVRKASGIDAQNRALQEVAPGEKLGKEFITGKFNRLRHPLHQNPETGSGVDYDSQDWSKVRYLPIGYTVKDGQVKPRVLSNAWISKKQGYGVIGDERFSWFKRKENPLYKPEKVKSKRDKIDESIQKHFDTNPNYVFRKEGGTIDLVKIRKFQNAGKFPEWYSKLYKFSQLKDWNTNLDYSSAGPSITNKNAGHFKAGDLNEAYNKNTSYISNPNLVSSDLQSYYSSSFNGKPLDDYIAEYNANAAKIRGYWDSERAYRESGASGHNQLFKNMFKSRSGNSEDAWNIGYDSNLEDTVGSSTWLRRMDRYEKEFDQLSDEEKKQRIHKIDLGNGNFGYVYKKANGDIAKWEEPTDSTKPSEPTPAKIDVEDTPQPKADGKKGISSIFSKLSPTITHGIPRAMYADRMNRKITDLAKESLTPLLKDPFEVHRYTRSDLDAEMQGERNYADLRRLASRPITSDGSLQTATQLQAEVQGQEARTLGKEKSNQVQRQYDELAWQQEKENAANRHETAMFNRAQQWGVEQDKSKFEQAYLSKKFNIWDVVGQQLEYDERVKQQENKALTDNFARSDIHNAVNYAPNEYGAGLSAEELSVWNKVLSGTNPSSLQPNEFNQYRLAMQKVSRVENEQLRQHYNIPSTRWSGKSMQSIPEQISIIKKGGVVSAKNGSKIAVAGIEAKTADAERFQKQIKETIDRNEKAIDRLSKSLYGIIKASMIK